MQLRHRASVIEFSVIDWPPIRYGLLRQPRRRFTIGSEIQTVHIGSKRRAATAILSRFLTHGIDAPCERWLRHKLGDRCHVVRSQERQYLRR